MGSLIGLQPRLAGNEIAISGMVGFSHTFRFEISSPVLLLNRSATLRGLLYFSEHLAHGSV